MSRAESEYSSEGAVCPYCQTVDFVETEDYSERERVQECSDCGKKYHLQQNFDVTHETTPDCALNGEEHRWIDAVTDGYEICDGCARVRKATSVG